jgi:Tol biopolymer transport system component/DNA-binding winged helix-turn-helix (wHTH) protein
MSVIEIFHQPTSVSFRFADNLGVAELFCKVSQLHGSNPELTRQVLNFGHLEVPVSANSPPRIIRFSTFEVNLHTGELRQQGQKVKLQEQPLQVLAALLERPGEIVTREELRSKLWSADTFVDFDHSLNAAIKRLRDALGESAEAPIFVETLARRGYRFIAPVVQDAAPQSEAPDRVVPADTAPSSVAEPRTTARDRKLWKTTIPAAALVIVLVGIFVWIGRPLPPPKVLNTTQITHDGVPKLNGILTDGSRLFIIETNGARMFLAQASVTGGDTSVIPTPFTNIAATDISRDHSHLLAVNLVGTETESQLWALPVAAGTPRELSDLVGHSGVWSSDGRQLAFAKGSDIYVANADGTNARKLITVSGAAYWIRFSPDGSRLRFTRGLQGTSSSIWEVRVDGTDFHRVLKGLNGPPSECCGVWSADGRYYLFVNNASDLRSDIWALRESPGFFYRRPLAPFQLTTGPMSLGSPVPSLDGRRLFAHGLLSRGELVRYESRSRQFAPFLSGISAGELDFSRDGKWVTYVSYPERTLWRSRIDGSESLQLTYAPVVAFLPRWSPDGTQIAYVDLQTGTPWRIFLISAQGGTPHELLAKKDNLSDPTWSPDGKRISFGRMPFHSGGTEKIAIEILDLSSKQISTIPGSENLYSPRWSPDGQHLAALSADSKKLLLYDFKKQKWTDWITQPGAIGFPSWSRDGRYVHYDNTSTKEAAFLRVQVGQTRSEFLIDLKDMHRYGRYGWAWSGLAPDDSALLVRDVSTDEIYSLDVELP